MTTAVRPIAVPMTTYNDIYVRDNFGDSGSYPSTGNPCQSPDIIPYQSGSLTWTAASNAYNGPDIGMNIVNGGVNNIYVRAKNLNTVAGPGAAGLYYANASLFLLPSTWTQILSAGGGNLLSFLDGSGSTSIGPGAIGLTNPSFLLTGLPPGPHYCLITVVQTPAHPITVPTSFPSNAAFTQWVQNNPSVGWRNISYAPNSSTQVVRIFGFASVNPTSGYFHFRILGRGFATGTPVTAQCSDQGCPINQNLTLPAPDINGNQITGFDASIPGNFSSNLVVTTTSPSGPFPTGATLTVTYYQYPSATEPLDLAVAGVFTIARGTTEEPQNVAATLIQIGECTVSMTSNSALVGESS